MKSERRHELQTNELADWLGEHLEAIKPYATQIAVGLVAVVVAILAGFYLFGGDDRAAALGLSTYFGALNGREPDKVMQSLAASKSGSTAALWAQQSLGDMNLAQGATQMFSDRAEAQKLLEKAKVAYEHVIAGAGNQPGLLTRAEIGLGKVYESLCKPDEAHKHYQRAAEVSQNSALGKFAKASAARMKNEREAALLAWFAEQTPKKPAPLPGFGGSVPGLPSDLPERPDISFPGLGDVGTGLPAEPTPGLPAPGTVALPPAGTSPAATTPEPATTPAPEAKAQSTTKAEAATPPGDSSTDSAKSDPAKTDPPKSDSP